MNRVLSIILLVLLYIFLLTGIFETLVNRASNTVSTVTAIVLFLAMTYFLFRFIRKQIKP